MLELRTLILAAGKGTRMKSQNAKVLHQAGGAALIEHVVAAARALGPSVLVVVGHQADKVRERVAGVEFVEQTQQLGTGHAVIIASERFAGYSGDLLVLPGDVPLIETATLQRFVEFHRQGGYAGSVLTADVGNPSGYGRILRRGDNEVEAIVEHRDATPAILAIQEINSSIYVFKTGPLFDALTRVRNQNAQLEYYLTDVVAILGEMGRKVGAFKAPQSDEVLGINTRAELAAIDHIMRRRKCESLMAEGVTIVDPDSTFIDAAVKIGPDTIIYPSVQIYGSSVIGDDAAVHSFSRISNCVIGSRSVVLEGCILVDSELGDDISVGPFAHVRMGATLEDGVKVGNFVEIKKSRLGAKTKSMHLAYLGDATIGKACNIGAGTITCNFDGVNKNSTIIEDNVFIGSDSQLIAPVKIGHSAYVAAGSSITDDVPSESLAIARGRQTIKEGWVRQRKKRS
jgi:bifunctional UDP-N-acetylglucosamine pyrophosphorylase/glucosamine-1-phosphate N-acetyltransferase